jgi:hypothetical protein
MNPKLKNTPLEIAESTLLDAASTIRERLEEHGHTERSFKLIGELWSSYITHAYTARDKLQLQAHDVAQMMALVKMSRAVYGYSMDNFVDSAGYTALAAMLTPPPPLPPPQGNDMPKATPFIVEPPVNKLEE